MEKRVTIYTLAKELGMSPSMVSRAFNPATNVDAEKRKRVLEAAERCGFTPNQFASRLSMRTIRIGVLIRDVYKPVTESLLRGIEAGFQQLKDMKVEYSVVRIPAEEKLPEECAEELWNLDGCDGVIVYAFSSAACVPMLTEFAAKNPNLVFLQSANDAVPYLFASRHNEQTASMLAAEFLYRCLHRSPAEDRKVLLFTGKLSGTMHKHAAECFAEGCRTFGLQLLECVDMQDSASVLEEKLPEVFARHPIESIGGIYITSAISEPLCRYLSENGYRGEFVTFDLYSSQRRYMETGVISATIYQNLEEQGQNAFSLLVQSVVSGVCMSKTVYTDVRLILQSNLSSVPNFSSCEETTE